jgi:glycosyltransferase involved in cell wall biosynthesis
VIRLRHNLADNMVVGFCGVLRPWHGVEMLVEAVAGYLPDHAHVLLIGDGPSANAVMELARALGLEDRVHVTGRIPHSEMAAHLAACDITVSPRATFYASPMKIVEYMAAGRAVVAPRMRNIEDLVDDGRTGLLFEPESVKSLGEVLARLAAEPGLRNSLARSARQQVEARLDWRKNAERIVEIAGELSVR